MQKNKQLLADIQTFDKSILINRVDYPIQLQNWVHNQLRIHPEKDPVILATYISTSAGFFYEETECGWTLRERPGLCSGCKCKTLSYICSKQFKSVYCLVCWFDCDRKFI